MEQIERIMVKDMTKKKFGTIKKSIKQTLPFEMFFLLTVSLLIVPNLINLYDLMINKNNYSTLNILLFAFIIVFSFVAVLFNKITLTMIIDRISNNKKIKLKEVLSLSISKLLFYLNFKNIGSITLYLLFIPGLYFTLFGYIVVQLLTLFNAEINTIIYLIGAYLLLILLLFKYIYFFNYIITDGKKNNKALKASTNLIKGNITKSISNILIINLIMIIGLLLSVILYRVLFMYNLLNTVTIFNTIMYTVLWLFIVLIISIYIILINTSITVTFNIYKKEKHEAIKKEKHLTINNWLIIPRLCKYTFVLFALILSFYSIQEELNYEPPKPVSTEITAHRGFSLMYPENTMSAFKGAQKATAKWIEVDVQKTKDNQYVIFHDDNLSRITGVNGRVFNMRFNELKTLDYGSYFDPKYSGEKIPLLAEVMEFAKKNKLNIILDLKNDWANIDYYEQDIIDMINKYDYSKHCVIETPFYKQIRNIKRIDSNIKTAYLIAMPNEELFDLVDADIISVDSVNINSYWINNIHKSGKKVYVWTPNEEEQIRKLLTLEIDNIITDNVDVALELNSNLEETTTK